LDRGQGCLSSELSSCRHPPSLPLSTPPTLSSSVLVGQWPYCVSQATICPLANWHCAPRAAIFLGSGGLMCSALKQLQLWPHRGTSVYHRQLRLCPSSCDPSTGSLCFPHESHSPKPTMLPVSFLIPCPFANSSGARGKGSCNCLAYCLDFPICSFCKNHSGWI
jgi:hypothetical protein